MSSSEENGEYIRGAGEFGVMRGRPAIRGQASRAGWRVGEFER